MSGVNQGGRCLCGGCKRVFSGLSTFDAHLRLLDSPPWSECRDPEHLLTKAGEHRFKFVNGVWSSASKSTWFVAEKNRQAP